MIPTKWDLLRAARCKDMTDDEYDRYWENISMRTCVSMRSGRKWFTFGTCWIPYQLEGDHHSAYWILVTTFDEVGNEKKKEWHLFDDPDDAVDKADEMVKAFSASVDTFMWGWD